MKTTSPSNSDTQAKPSFAPRASHVDNQQRQQEKANSQSLNQTAPQGAKATPTTPKTPPSASSASATPER